MSDLILSPHKKTGIPRIAIIGRTNVGKSTLFNRLVKSRRAITDAVAGVTRDAVEAEGRIGELPCLLIDTGGYKIEKDDFSEIVSRKALAAASEADLVLLLVDVYRLDTDDLAFIELVRPFADKLILVINKVDTHDKENLTWNYYELGFKKIVAVSAAHGRNIEELEKEVSLFFRDYRWAEPQPESGLIRIAIMGKPNTGKSTLANHLVGEDRSLVSEIPGTTRDMVEGRFSCEGRQFQIMDTAGIRRKKKVIDQVEYYSVNRAIGSISEADIVYLLVDSLEGIADQDKKIAHLAVEKGRGVILVLSKWDTMKQIPNTLEAITDRTRFLFPVLSFAPILPVSGATGFGIKKLIKTSVEIKSQLEKRIETAKLNAALKKWVEYYPLRSKGKPIKILYATQVSTNPVKFVFFVSRKTGFRNEYIIYLKNKIKSDLGFNKIPFTLDIREKNAP